MTPHTRLLARARSDLGATDTVIRNVRYFRNGLPYRCSGRGPHPLAIGLTYEHKPQAVMLITYTFLENDYTLYGVLRKSGLPQGYTLGDMADDCAAARERFGGPADVLGVSTGDAFALHSAADHLELVRRLVIHSSAHTLNDTAEQSQLKVVRLAQQGQWMNAWAGTVLFAVGCLAVSAREWRKITSLLH